MKTILALACLLTASTPSVAIAQDEDPGNTVSAEDLRLGHYTPLNVDARDLYKLSLNMVGRHFYVKERGRSNPVSNLALLGDEIILYDTEAYTRRLLSALASLDVAAPEEQAAAVYQTTTYSPRHIAIEDAYVALEPFMGHLENGRMNVTMVRQRRTLVLRDTAAQLEAMKETLASIDSPEPQVLLTCYLLRGMKDGADSSGVPVDLAANLTRLLPAFQFESIGFAMLQSAVVPDRTVALSMSASDNVSFRLSFVPVAYDTESGSVRVSECQVEVTTSPAGNARAYTESILSTETVFRGGQYTVLGATGADPVFVVVHVNAVD